MEFRNFSEKIPPAPCQIAKQFWASLFGRLLRFLAKNFDTYYYFDHNTISEEFILAYTPYRLGAYMPN